VKVINEHFFKKGVAQKYGLDVGLPIRLQKKALLKTLGFTLDGRLQLVQASDLGGVQRLLSNLAATGAPFLILVDERFMRSHIPPLYFIRNKEDVVFRNHEGSRKALTWEELELSLLRHAESTWLSFVPVLWHERSLAARLIYEGENRQVLEMQRGTSPSQLLNDRSLACFAGEISHLDVDRLEYILVQQRLEALSFKVLPFGVVRTVCRSLSTLESGFESLTRIASMPTLEFAFQENGELIVVDVDWPSQWVDTGG
jgi:hypothetical protein